MRVLIFYVILASIGSATWGVIERVRVPTALTETQGSVAEGEARREGRGGSVREA